jgi:hypothetical protein
MIDMRIEDRIDNILLEFSDINLKDPPKDSWSKRIAKKALQKGKDYLISLIKDLLWSLFHESIRQIQYNLSAYNVSTAKSNNINRRIKQIVREAEFHKGRLIEILRELEDITNDDWDESDIASIDDKF